MNRKAQELAKAVFEAKSYTVGVKVPPGKGWQFGPHRFPSHAEAEAYGQFLRDQWVVIEDHTVHPSTEVPTARFQEGKLVTLKK